VSKVWMYVEVRVSRIRRMRCLDLLSLRSLWRTAYASPENHVI
jgi:hypothetical protein